MITIEQYLDPDNIFQFENFTDLSPKFQQLLQVDNENQEKSNVLRKMGMIAQHLESYRKWAEHGMRCMQTNQMEESAYAWIMALHDDQINPEFWLNIAQIFTNFDMFDVVDKAIHIAKKIDPNYEALSRIINRIENYRKMNVPKNKGSTKKEKNSASMVKIAQNTFHSQNFNRVLFRFKQGVDLNPKDNLLWNNLAAFYLQFDETEKGEHALNKPLELSPKDPMIQYNFMNLYVQKDNMPMAIQKVRDALALDPTNVYFINKLRQMTN